MSHHDIKTQILDTLNDLEDNNFEKFRFMLPDRREQPRIRAGEVEKSSRVEITKLLVSRCTEAGAVVRTINTLKNMGCNGEAQGLEQWNKARLEKLRPSLRYSSSGVVELQPSADAQAVVAARTPLEELSPESQFNNPKDEPLPLGRSILVFGQYRGQSFEWLLQNDVGYAVYVVATHQEERETDGKQWRDSEHMKNKDALAEYVRFFPKIVEKVHFHREGLAPLGFGEYKESTRKDFYNSKDEKKKSYVQWLRGKAQTCKKGSQMETMIKYILHRDKHQPGPSRLTSRPMRSYNMNKYSKGKRSKSAASKQIR